MLFIHRIKATIGRLLCFFELKNLYFKVTMTLEYEK